MNGTCAGGTGAFIDQMATLLKVDATGLNTLAADYTNLYPIASRCGVLPERTTRQTASMHRASGRASLTRPSGEVSMMTRSNQR